MKAEIKNLKKAASRILKAVKNKEKIILYGDADLDGVCSVILLEEAVKNLGGEVAAVYFPDREAQGYGINKEALATLEKFSPALLISLDLGISNFKEIKLANKKKFEVLVVDHHEVLDKLPEAKIVVDPKQKGDKYPFKGLAAAGVVFKLVEALLKEKLTDGLRRSFLELTALATLADMMPKEQDNVFLIEKGLESLENSWRPGIRGFFLSDFLSDYPALGQKISKIISILNVRDVESDLPASFRLLTLSSDKEAAELIAKLIDKNKERSERISQTVALVQEKLALNQEPIIFEGGPLFESAVISPAASILCQKYKKPTFIFKQLAKDSQGTVRTPAEVDSVALMKKCKKHLLSFGGHPRASGFRIKNENLEKFKECLIKNICGK